MKILTLAFIVTCFTLVLGCAASTTNGAPVSSADPCAREPNMDAYMACSKKYAVPATAAPQAPPPDAPVQVTVQPPVKPHAPQRITIEAPPAQPAPPQPTITVQAPRGEMPAPPPVLPMGQVIAAPVPALPGCGIPDSVALVLNNNTDWLIEVRGPVSFLQCEMGDKVIPAKVRRHNGAEETIQVIGPHTTNVRLMFLRPGVADVHYEAYQPYGAYLPAVAVGHAATRFGPQNPMGGAQWQDLRQVGSFKLYPYP